MPISYVHFTFFESKSPPLVYRPHCTIRHYCYFASAYLPPSSRDSTPTQVSGSSDDRCRLVSYKHYHLSLSRSLVPFFTLSLLVCTPRFSIVVWLLKILFQALELRALGGKVIGILEGVYFIRIYISQEPTRSPEPGKSGQLGSSASLLNSSAHSLACSSGCSLSSFEPSQ